MPYGRAMTRPGFVLEVLGGSHVSPDAAPSDFATLRKRIKAGLPFRAVEELQRRLHLTLPETAAILHTPPRTLARRKRERRLHAAESDRLVRFARVAAHAVAVFGDEAKAAAWLRRPNRALNGDIPLHILDTELGMTLVDDILSRIEYGIVG